MQQAVRVMTAFSMRKLLKGVLIGLFGELIRPKNLQLPQQQTTQDYVSGRFGNP